MTLVGLPDSNELKIKYNTQQEYKTALTRVRTAFLNSTTVLKADSNYSTEASASEESDIDSDETAVTGLTLT